MSDHDKDKFAVRAGLGWVLFAIGCMIFYYGCDPEHLRQLLEAVR